MIRVTAELELLVLVLLMVMFRLSRHWVVSWLRDREPQHDPTILR